MLTCQRDQFDLPPGVTYLSAASYSPLPRRVMEVGHAGVARKGRPWMVTSGIITTENESARAAAARLVGARPDDMALVSSIGYGVATAGKVITPAQGSRVLVLEEDHASPVLEWMARAPAGRFTIETVRRPEDYDWTSAVIAAIERKDPVPVSLASISSVHWSDGTVIDVARIAPVLRRHGAALVVDATQAAGVMDIDVATLDPDFLAFPTYKWLLGPYGRAFLYVAPRHHGGTPLEQTAHGRRSVSAESAPYFADTAYVADARRFDMGERDHFISMGMAATGIEMILEWTPAAIRAHVKALTDRLADRLAGLPGLRVPDARYRAPHLLCLSFDGGISDHLTRALAEADIHVAARIGRLRVSPHVYNDADDIDRMADVIRRQMR
jgi:selenocysteine lyase/cysteine desulfurase